MFRSLQELAVTHRFMIFGYFLIKYAHDFELSVTFRMKSIVSRSIENAGFSLSFFRSKTPVWTHGISNAVPSSHGS